MQHIHRYMETEPGSVALIVGVTGMAGFSLARALKASKRWTVYGSARRDLPGWFDSAILDKYIQFDALDRAGTVGALSGVATRVTHLFWVALAAREREEENIRANSGMLENVLYGLTSVGGSKLRHVTVQTGTKHYFGPFVDPGQMHKIGLVEVPFCEDAPRLPYPQFYYALEDILKSHSETFTWSVHRSSLIFGASSRSIYNPLLTVAVYALICRYERKPFVYPGSSYTWNHFCDASDAELLADQQIWAATTPAAAYHAFNCTNGDVFTWRSIWKVMSELFKVEFMDSPTEDVGPDWVGKMKSKGGIWDRIVEENGLVRTDLEEITTFDAVYTVLNFKFQHVCSVNKSREFGFCKTVNTLKSVGKWVGRLRDMNLIPKD